MPSESNRPTNFWSWAGRAFVVLSVIGLGFSSWSQPLGAKEYQIKAAFLLNFTHFVQWPTNSFPADSPIVIGVLGENPFGTVLEATVRGETVSGRPFEVQRYDKVEEIKLCHVLFISQSEAPHLESTLGQLKGRPILTVGENENFAFRGGMVRFLTEKNKIRLRINLGAAQAEHLILSSQLLRLAEIVSSKAK